MDRAHPIYGRSRGSTAVLAAGVVAMALAGHDAAANGQGMIRLAPEAHEYVKANNMPARRVPLQARAFDRLFVAVTPQTFPHYLKVLDGKAIVWADPVMPNGDRVHVPLYLNQQQATFGQVALQAAQPAQHGWRFIPIAATPQMLEYVTQQIAQFGNNQQAYMQHYPQRLVQKANHQNNGGLGGGCMWLWMHMFLSDNLALPHHAGISRCANPPELANRLVHSGNENVGPIGYMVQDQMLPQFGQHHEANTPPPAPMFSNEILLGPPPQAGPPAVVRD